MATIHKSIDIDAPAERVFAILIDPKRIPDYTPAVINIEDIRQTERQIDDSFRVIYSVLGLHFPMIFTVTVSEQPTKRIMHFEGGMKGTWTWRLEPHEHGTRLTTAIEYKMAGGILGKTINAVLVERMNEKNVERQQDHLKLISEATPS
jgi:carbon monoxide dehydrogenase subunit G